MEAIGLNQINPGSINTKYVITMVRMNNIQGSQTITVAELPITDIHIIPAFRIDVIGDAEYRASGFWVYKDISTAFNARSLRTTGSLVNNSIWITNTSIRLNLQVTGMTMNAAFQIYSIVDA